MAERAAVDAGQRHAARVLDRLLAATPVGSHRVLAVDGRSGSGKTTLADAVAELLRARGLATERVHLDELYPGWDGLAAAVPALVQGVLAPLAAGQPAGFTRWDWHAGGPAGRRRVRPAPFVLVEGAGCGSRPARPYLSLLVWLHAPARLRYARAMARDGAAYAPHWQRWAGQEDRVFAVEGTRAAADLVLATG